MQDTKRTDSILRAEPSSQVDALAHAVIGAAIEVHRAIGPGFLESVYEEALGIELALRNIPYIRQTMVGIDYKGHRVGESRLDFLVGDELVVELKAVDALLPLHSAQVMSYLKVTRHELGLLINFNTELLKHSIKRIIMSN